MVARRIVCLALVLVAGRGYTQETDFVDSNPENIITEHKLYEENNMLTEPHVRDRRSAVKDSSLWPIAFPVVIPYRIVEPLVRYPDLVREAVGIWTSHTCIKFVEDNTTTGAHVYVQKGSGCSSAIGYRGTTGHHVTLGSGCNTLGVKLHEFGHILGLFHTHSREDRDQFVTILWDNIRTGEEGNFQIRAGNSDDRGIPYNMDSIMHYPPTTKSANGKVTVRPKNLLYLGSVGHTEYLSHRDKLLVNKMYNCIDRWLEQCNMDSDPCQNEGYMGASCECVCPQNTAGTHCETVTAGFFGFLDHNDPQKLERRITALH